MEDYARSKAVKHSQYHKEDLQGIRIGLTSHKLPIE